jgi:exopolysaccharide biosynthesis WecB/TagA/CpsF family protein
MSDFLKIIDSVKVIESDSQERNLIDYILKNKSVTIGFVNHFAINTAMENRDFLENLLRHNILLRDGIGIKIAMGLLKKKPGLNMNGTDFIDKLLRTAKARGVNKVAILGCEPEWIARGCEKFEEKYQLKVVVSEHGYHESPYYERLGLNGVDIIILAMGMPKQELLATKMNGNSVVISGGAFIDFTAGKFKRAPLFFQKISCEWLFRLILEPKRLFKRYVLGIPLFFIRLLYAKFQ